MWNGASPECSKEWLLGLERDVRTALPTVLNVSNEQIANLRVSQLWLRIKLWELFPRFGFLSSESVYECLTFAYPVVLARDLVVVAMKLPVGSLRVHGVGLVCSNHPTYHPTHTILTSPIVPPWIFLLTCSFFFYRRKKSST